MSAIHVSHVSYSYSSAVAVIDDASFDLGPGWTGLVGENGSGKSTLLALIAGQYVPDTGAVETVPSGATPILCEQRVDASTSAINRFAESWSRAAIRLRAALALDPDDVARWPTLSPGERKRWQVGAALVSEPGVLLLDEPTNHLDETARALLVDALKRFGGAGIVVSHDRHLLRTLTTRTLRIHRGEVTLWGGAYQTARDSWEAEDALARSALGKLKRERERAQRLLADQRRTGREKDAKRLKERRDAGIHDLDTRGAVATGRHASGQRAGARAREVTRGRVEALAGEIERYSFERSHGGAITFPASRADRAFLTGHDGPVSVPGGPTLFHASVWVSREDRVHLCGPNGVGKTTLLNALIAGAAIPRDRMLVLAQETTEHESAAWLGAARALPARDRGRVMSFVSLLGSDPGQLLASDLPSPGEARKLALALGLGTPTWLLVLDEPTNHLDVPTIERLQAALASYPGALLIVTHDDDLAAAVTSTTWALDPASGLTRQRG